MLAVLFGIKCKKKVLAKKNNAQKSASTIGKRRLLMVRRHRCRPYRLLHSLSNHAANTGEVLISDRETTERAAESFC